MTDLGENRMEQNEPGRTVRKEFLSGDIPFWQDVDDEGVRNVVHHDEQIGNGESS